MKGEKLRRKNGKRSLKVEVKLKNGQIANTNRPNDRAVQRSTRVKKGNTEKGLWKEGRIFYEMEIPGGERRTSQTPPTKQKKRKKKKKRGGNI